MLPDKMRTGSGYFSGQIYAGLGFIFLAFTPFILTSCGDIPVELITEEKEEFELLSAVEEAEIKAVLNGSVVPSI